MPKELTVIKKTDDELLDELHIAFTKTIAALDDGYDELLAEYHRVLEKENAIK